MRYTLVAALALFISGSSFAMDESDKDAKAGEHKAIDGKAVNTIDPVNGEKVDTKIAPIEAKTKDGKVILIGVSSQKSAEKIKKEPGDYVDAALANKKTETK